MVEIRGLTLVIDTGPDFRQQMLRHHVHKLDAILFTHQHRDHTAGLDDIRAYNFFQGRTMDLYLPPEVETALRKEYYYIFEKPDYPGLPELRFHHIENNPFSIEGVLIQPVEVMHYNMRVFGYRFNNFAYITDANHIPAPEMEKLQGLEVLIINALRIEKHISHFSLDEALEVIARLQPKNAYLTHISHQMGTHRDLTEKLPNNVFPACDGLRLEIAG